MYTLVKTQQRILIYIILACTLKHGMNQADRR